MTDELARVLRLAGFSPGNEAIDPRIVEIADEPRRQFRWPENAANELRHVLTPLRH